MQKIILSMALGLLLGFLGGYIVFHISTIGIYEDGWDVHPTGGAGVKPTFIDRPGSNDSWRIGHQNGNNGAAGSAISQGFDCGDNDRRYCTVTFSILGSSIAQGEKAYAYIKSGGTDKKMGIPSSNIGAPKEYKLAVLGCAKTAEVKFGIEGTSSTASIGSTINITSVNTDCLIGDQSSDTLLNMAAEPGQ